MNNFSFAAVELEQLYKTLGFMLKGIEDAESNTFNQGMMAAVFVIRGMVHAQKEGNWTMAKALGGIE